jgi:hypothetical protein
MGRTLTAREVGQVLGVSSKTVRDWANDGVLKGVKIDNGPGKEGWEFREEDVYSCPDTRVTNRLKPAEVDGRRNAQQRIEDLELEIEALRASLEATGRSLHAEREERENAFASELLLHETELGELKEKTETYEDACFAVEKAIRSAVESIRLKRDVDKLFEHAGMRVEYKMANDGAAWDLRYQIRGTKAWYELQEYRYEPQGPLGGLNRSLLAKEAGEFRGCRKPLKEKLQARRALYGVRLLAIATALFFILMLLMALGVLATWPALGIMASMVAVVLAVNFHYWTRIEILKRKEREGQ